MKTIIIIAMLLCPVMVGAGCINEPVCNNDNSICTCLSDGRPEEKSCGEITAHLQQKIKALEAENELYRNYLKFCADEILKLSGRK